MSEREVKMTRRTPTTEQDSEISFGLPQKYVGDHPWIVGHDAAPDATTEALEGLVWAIYNLRHGPNSEYAVYARYVDTYLGALSKTHDGAALIRQAMERDGST